MRARHHRVADLAAGAGNEVDDAGWKAGGLHELHQMPAGKDRRRRGLPQHGIAHEGRCGGQIARDGCEVEGRHGKNKALESAVLDLVPISRPGLGLLLVDETHVVGVETPEIHQLAGGVDLGLENALRLVEHAGGVEAVAPWSGEQFGGLEHHRGAVLPRRLRPLLPGLGGGVDRHRYLGLAGLVIDAQDVPVVVRTDGFGGLAGAHLLAADDERDLDLLLQHPGDCGLERGFFRRARGIGADRIVDRRRNADNSIGHDGPPVGERNSWDAMRLARRVGMVSGRGPNFNALLSIRHSAAAAAECRIEELDCRSEFHLSRLQRHDSRRSTGRRSDGSVSDRAVWQPFIDSSGGPQGEDRAGGGPRQGRGLPWLPVARRWSSPRAVRSPTIWRSVVWSRRVAAATSSPRRWNTRRFSMWSSNSSARGVIALTVVDVDRDGRVDAEAVAAALRNDTVLVSLMLANNEVGTLQPVREVAALCRGSKRGDPHRCRASGGQDPGGRESARRRPAVGGGTQALRPERSGRALHPGGCRARPADPWCGARARSPRRHRKRPPGGWARHRLRARCPRGRSRAGNG